MKNIGDTIGVSPKVWVPLVGGVLLGIVFLLIGLIAKDSTYQTIGLAVISAALGHSGLGYLAPAGRVVPPSRSASGQ